LYCLIGRKNTPHKCEEQNNIFFKKGVVLPLLRGNMLRVIMQIQRNIGIIMEYYTETRRHDSVPSLHNDIFNKERDWETLYSRSPCQRHRYFTSPSFLKSWIINWPSHVVTYSSRLFKGDKCVGIAFFGCTRETIGKILKPKTLHLMRTGLSDVDQVWPEFIEPVSDLSSEELSLVWPHWVASVMRDTGASQMIQHVTPLSSMLPHSKSTEKRVALRVENQEGGPYRDLSIPLEFKSSTRRKLSQTNRYFKEEPLHLKEMIAPDDVKNLLSLMSKWHRQKWDRTDTPSGFNNPYFKATLHQMALGSSTPSFALMSGQKIVGGTILVEDDAWVGFYLSGYQSFESNHVHLGIAMHAKLMQHFQDRGKRVYDFMAGEDSYKGALSTHHNTYARGRWVKQRSIIGLAYRILGDKQDCLY
jgi:hypothetical protein